MMLHHWQINYIPKLHTLTYMHTYFIDFPQGGFSQTILTNRSETLILKLQDVGTSMIQSHSPMVSQLHISNRKQVVRIHSMLSEPLPVSSGVPKGSILGPLLI